MKICKRYEEKSFFEIFTISIIVSDIFERP